MKAISLHQPWASLIAIGLKSIETRSWYTSYRGPVAIHAAKKITPEGIDLADELMGDHSVEDLCGGDDPLELCAKLGDLAVVPIGCVVATAHLVDCRSTEMFDAGALRQEFRFGNFARGRYGFVLDRVTRLTPPVAARGMQGLFDLPQGWLCS